MSDRAGHLDDGALVRVLDRQPTPGEEAAHLADCTLCRARLHTLEVRSAGFSELLMAGRAAEPAPPADLWQRVQAAAPGGAGGAVVDLARERERRAGRGSGFPWGSPAARAAAVAGLLLAGALAAEPVRAWIAEGIERAVLALTGDPQAAPGRAPAPAESAAPAVKVSFVPAGDRLLIRIDEPQPAGTVRVVFENRPDALGEVLTEDEDASLLVLPDGFRARNAGGKDWSYRFHVPATLAGVRVLIAGRPVAELMPADGSAVLEVRGTPAAVRR